MIKETAEEIYKDLLKRDKLTTKIGKISFTFNNVDIVVKQRDVVGNIIQEWVDMWLTENEVEHAPNPNSQMPPDFFLDPSDLKHDMLEVKAFNANASPGFDIADFKAFQQEIIQSPWMLDVDYLIFGYLMDINGNVKIKNIWLKKIWEITRPSANWPMNLQVKKHLVHKIRPGAWYKKSQFPMFKSLEHFLSALEETVWQNQATREESSEWLSKFVRSYRSFYGKDISVPRWNDIKDQYYKN